MMRNFDLNNPPHFEEVNTNLELGLPSSQVMANQDIDDNEVTIISHELFQRAVNRSRRNQMMIQIPYAEVGTQRGASGSGDTNANCLQTILTTQTNDGVYHSAQGEVRELVKDKDAPESSRPMTQQRVPTFNCPICMEQLVEETSTRCGHIFCRSCIVAALDNDKKCPICRRKVRKRDIIRIYLSNNS